MYKRGGRSLINNDYSLFELNSNEMLTEEVLKKKLRKLQLKYHPNKGGNEAIFIKLEPAYERLLRNIKKIGKSQNTKKKPKIPHKHQLAIKRYLEKKGYEYELIKEGDIFNPKNKKNYVKIGTGKKSKMYKIRYNGKYKKQGNNTLYTAICNDESLLHQLKNIPKGSIKLKKVLNNKFDLLLTNNINLIGELKKLGKENGISVKTKNNSNLKIKYASKNNKKPTNHSVKLTKNEVLITSGGLEAPRFSLKKPFLDFRNKYFRSTTKKGVWQLKKQFK